MSTDFPRGPAPLHQVNEPGPGLYAMFVTPCADLAGTVLSDTTPGTLIYIGKSEEPLIKRVARTHAATGKTSHSTLRRTLGAVLRDKLELVPIPRKDGRRSGYGFEAEGDEALTQWTAESLEARWLPLPLEEVRVREKELIQKYRPVLNLTYCRTELSPVIRALRSWCREMARTRLK